MRSKKVKVYSLQSKYEQQGWPEARPVPVLVLVWWAKSLGTRQVLLSPVGELCPPQTLMQVKLQRQDMRGQPAGAHCRARCVLPLPGLSGPRLHTTWSWDGARRIKVNAQLSDLL